MDLVGWPGGNLCFFASSGKICGCRRASAGRLGEEPAELSARGIERFLTIFPAVIQKRAAVLDHLEQDLSHGPLSQR